jgi:hypothetical protein
MNFLLHLRQMLLSFPMVGLLLLPQVALTAHTCFAALHLSAAPTAARRSCPLKI